MRQKTYVAEAIQDGLCKLRIGEGELKDWARRNGFDVKVEYQSIWENATGKKVSKDPFLARLAQRLGVDPAFMILSAHADRATEPFKPFFLAARERLTLNSDVVKGWAQLDPETREAICTIISDPDEARRLVKVHRAMSDAQ